MTPSGVEQKRINYEMRVLGRVNPTMTPSGVEQIAMDACLTDFESEPDDDAFGR